MLNGLPCRCTWEVPIADVCALRFKLHLRPGHLTGMKIEDLPPLPQGKSAIDVLSDYLGYLYDCARKYIQESHASGDLLWSSVQGRIDFVLSHPNGWEGSQQSKMRQAAVRAGLVPHTEAGRSRIHFVTEGEASLHFCLDSGLATEITKVCIHLKIGSMLDILFRQAQVS